MALRGTDAPRHRLPKQFGAYSMRFLMGVVFLVVLAGCGESAAPPAAETVEPPAAQASAGTVALSALTGAEFAMPLNGELGCSFTVGESVFLVAMGNVDDGARSEALARANGVAQRLAASAIGGYDAMVEGASFVSDALTVEVRTSARNEAGNERVAYNATLTARAGGAVQTSDGVWTCGP
jgi:hypothetical protein